MTTTTIHLRSVLTTDIDLICRHREEVFRESGIGEVLIAEMSISFRSWLKIRLADGRYFGFIAETDGKPVGGVGLMEIEWAPHPEHPRQDKRGYVLNVFVEPLHRRRGIARALLNAADHEFRTRGLTYLVLHATKSGQSMYEVLGWARTSEMAKKF